MRVNPGFRRIAIISVYPLPPGRRARAHGTHGHDALQSINYAMSFSLAFGSDCRQGILLHIGREFAVIPVKGFDAGALPAQPARRADSGPILPPPYGVLTCGKCQYGSSSVSSAK
jgi:hypothetical protein